MRLHLFPGVACPGYIHFFHLKTAYSEAPSATIAATASGYPNDQCSSGIASKFMP